MPSLHVAAPVLHLAVDDAQAQAGTSSPPQGSLDRQLAESVADGAFRR
jgi:hypothetical protein